MIGLREYDRSAETASKYGVLRDVGQGLVRRASSPKRVSK